MKPAVDANSPLSTYDLQVALDKRDIIEQLDDVCYVVDCQGVTVAKIEHEVSIHDAGVVSQVTSLRRRLI